LKNALAFHRDKRVRNLHLRRKAFLGEELATIENKIILDHIKQAIDMLKGPYIFTCV
jgi:hypothetical protein